MLVQCRSRVKMPQELVKQHVTHPKREDMPRAQQPPVDMLQRRSDGASHRQSRVRSQEAMEFSKGPPHETGASTHQPKQKNTSTCHHNRDTQTKPFAHKKPWSSKVHTKCEQMCRPQGVPRTNKNMQQGRQTTSQAHKHQVAHTAT